MYHRAEQKINILKESVARRIAAGEVIDRPQAVVRELLDNAIDANSTEINLHIKGGGIDEIRIVDNGIGMNKDDLKKCFLPHATSKIKDFEDIYKINSLGFRGEALSSIASCSKLSIISNNSEDSTAHKIEIRDGKITNFNECKGSKGTIISVKDLFYSMPGRKNFLKSVSTESTQCKSMFIEKALSHNEIDFKYFVNDNLVLFLPKSDILSRIKISYGSLFHNSMFYETEAKIDDIKIKAVAGSLSLYRKDRRYIHVFINKRRVAEYSLVHAIDYAYSMFLPGGCHPVCFLFLEISPKNVDFNIHPAKREVKFRSLPSIHNVITQFISNFLSTKTKLNLNSLKSSGNPNNIQHNLYNNFSFNETISKENRNNFNFTAKLQDRIINENFFKENSLSNLSTDFKKEINTNRYNLLFLGQLFNLFLLFEYNNNLLIIDQHAAHEKKIFDKITSEPPIVQELLIPLELILDKDEEYYLEKNIETYKNMGFNLQKIKDNNWLINSMPSICNGIENTITDFFKNNITDENKLKRNIYAQISCKSAIKDGELISSITALELASDVLNMDNPRCPHGRPIIQLLSQNQIFKMFGRTF